ncbi:casein kinase I isoform X2 [Folsomia candida]|uniref:casein kinase I isoform X2 n=1 Tax=Folsomia candida TaxID=158441 RepID=UPI000B8FADC0|nr:casein kinase I isoform X2 [Folsomia candida]
MALSRRIMEIVPREEPLLKRYKILVWGPSYSSAMALDTKNNSVVFINIATRECRMTKVRKEKNILLKLTSDKTNKFFQHTHIGLPEILDYKTVRQRTASASGETVNYLVLKNAGKSLEILHDQEKMTFTISEMSKLAVHLIDILEYVHHTGLIHGDIHARNVVVAGDLRTDDYRITLIEFKNGGRYKRGEDHIAEIYLDRDENSYRSYCSSNIYGLTQSRKHDLEMVGLMLIELRGGRLPCRQAKRRKLPNVFYKFVEYCQHLHFDQDPDYTRWRSKFLELV